MQGRPARLLTTPPYEQICILFFRDRLLRDDGLYSGNSQREFRATGDPASRGGFHSRPTPGYAEAAPKLSWDFGAQPAVCPQNVHFAERVSAADSRQVAFMQGNNADNNPAVDPPSSIFGINVTGLEVGKEYEISRQQAERATDTGKGAITA